MYQAQGLRVNISGRPQLVFVTWARVVCLICIPRGTRAAGPRAEGVHIRHTTRAHVTNTKCNTFTPKIKRIYSITYLIFPYLSYCKGYHINIL